MKYYLNKIELTKNFRGVWDLDTFKGCINSKLNNNKGCYGICYATKIAKSKGYDFSKVIKRHFISDAHFIKIINKIKKIPFVRIGVMCDPSHNWEHTLKITNKIKNYQENIIIVTKHLNILNSKQLENISYLIINTSISALDKKEEINKKLFWYNKLKYYCKKSILRVCTADFNNIKLLKIQEELLNNENVINNILRFPKNHKLVKDGIININKYKFLNSKVYASKHNEKTYFSYCDNCLDLCGANLTQNKLKRWL
jgi:hypothetical protein|tara:strand:- start:17812 stop:18579 length:768 start_codon:yes stop_codon:yes gene_type:complete